VNLPELAYLDAVRRPVPSPAVSPEPVREAIWIHETALPRSLAVTLRRDQPAVRRVLAEVLRIRRRPVGAFWAARDPRPLVAELVRTAGLAAGALVRRLPGRRVPLAGRRASPW
jgi:D-aspartate ligase